MWESFKRSSRLASQMNSYANFSSAGSCATALLKAHSSAGRKPMFSSADGLRSSQMWRISLEITSISRRIAAGDGAESSYPEVGGPEDGFDEGLAADN